MNDNQLPLIFDGHNDALLRLHLMHKKDAHRNFLEGDGQGHLDMPRIHEGGMGGGFFAIYVPSDLNLEELISQMSQTQYDVELPDEVPFEEALPVALSMAADLIRIENDSQGKAKICRTAAEIRDCLDEGIFAMIMHMEGAEAISEDFSSLEVLYEAGLRSIGPVWSRPTRFGHGVPFRFPSSPDTGPGLSDIGKEFVKVCNAKKILFDLAHLNEAGFWDVAKISNAPLIATHSNAHAICQHSRNLTDKQLAAIKESSGVVGVNFATAATRPDGQSIPETTIAQMLHHFDYLIEKLGVDGVAIGSDFDGATISGEIGDVTGLTHLRTAMRDNGYDEETMGKICHGNWLNVLERTLGA